MSTPLGRPVEPEVYMITARSVGFGATARLGFCSPTVTRVANVTTLMLRKSLAAKSSGSSPITMMWARLCWLLSELLTDLSSSAETTRIRDSVSLSACARASAPRFAYTVASVTLRWKHACAHICHSRHVSA
eukprot:Amastigsp_a508946_38.p4 type:complete len:132 gc:universal Amastigsp_a508946_38:1324-1719(+)